MIASHRSSHLAPAAAMALFLCLGLMLTYSQALIAAEPPWTARDATTSLNFNQDLMRDLGLEVRGIVADDTGAYRFAAPQPWSLLFEAPGGAFVDIVGGQLVHQGGFHLRWHDGSTSMVSFALARGSEIRTFDLVDAAGEVIFVADHMHMQLDVEGRKLRLFNMDLRLSEDFARRIGEPRHAGLAVGVLALDATVDVPDGFEIPGNSNCALPDWDADVDVALVGINSISQAARAGGQVVVTPSATLKNVGTADVPWYSKFTAASPPFGNDQHPYLVWAMYRVADGVIEQLGQSQVKHAFLTINSVCVCEAGNILWAGTGQPGHPTEGCEDTYGTFTNNDPNNLAPRDEVTVSTGEWESCNSHFDQNGDCSQDHFGGGDNAFTHGMVIDEADLSDPEADYYMEAWYIVREDIDIFNTMGYRQVNPTFSGNTWSFQSLTPLIEGPALNAWFPPINPPAPISTSNEVLDTGEGTLQIAVNTTNLGAGLHRFVFAVMNHDFDRRIDAFAMPLGAGVDVSDFFFADPDSDTDNDWNVTVAGNGVTWQAPTPEAALDWGTLLTFGFTANAVPEMSEFPLSVVEPGNPGTLLVPGLAPINGVSDDIFADAFESGDISAWGSN